MPQRAFRLSDDQNAFIDAQVRSGAADNADSVVADALAIYKALHEAETAELERIVAAGVADMEAGRYYDITDPADEEAFWRDLTEEVDAAVARERASRDG